MSTEEPQLRLSDLPDDLLASILRCLPESEARAAPNVQIATRGAAERVCRRWRRLCLPMCGELRLATWGEEQWEPEAVLRCLAGRTPRSLHLNTFGWQDGSRERWLSLAQLLPAVERLKCIGGGVADVLQSLGGLNFCSRLEELSVFSPGPLISAAKRAALYVEAPKALGRLPTLRGMELDIGAVSEDLAAAVAALPALEAASFASLTIPGAAAFSHLRRLGTRLNSLNLGLGTDPSNLFDPFNPFALEEPLQLPPGLLALTAANSIELSIAALQPLPSLPGLDRVPALHRLEAHGSLPVEAWRCCHLTFLHLAGCEHIPQPASAGQAVPALRCLQLHACSLGQWAVPPQLCVLSQLTSLEVFSCHRVASFVWLHAPAQLSSLGRLQRLSLRGTRLEAASLTVLGSLACLSSLDLEGTSISTVPDGSLPPTLHVLQLHHNELTPLVPPAINAATALRSLNLSLPGTLRQLQVAWLDLQGLLRMLPRLEVLTIQFERNVDLAAPAPAALLRQLLAAAGFSCSVQELGMPLI